MIKTLVIIGLGLSTVVLGASTGYLAYERAVDKAAIKTLTGANTATNASIREIVDMYNQQITSGKAFSDGINTDLSNQLNELANDYNATSSALSITKANLEGATESYKNFAEVVDKLNAANSRVSELEARTQTVQDIQGIIDQLNAANSKVASLEAELAFLKGQ